MSYMNNGSPQGIGVGVGDIDVLKDTDIGVLRRKTNKDKSKYTRTTQPDGTVVEEIKMNQKNTSTGVVDLQTQGVNLGKRAVDIGVSEKSTEDAVGFVDSIWGSRQAAGKIQDRRMMEAQAKAGVKPTQPTQSAPTQGMPNVDALANFKNQRQAQLSEDHMVRELAAQQQMGLPAPDQSMGRAM